MFKVKNIIKNYLKNYKNTIDIIINFSFKTSYKKDIGLGAYQIRNIKRIQTQY